MDLDAFRASLGNDQPPAGLATALEALWFAGKDNWDRAHKLAQSAAGPGGEWVHPCRRGAPACP